MAFDAVLYFSRESGQGGIKVKGESKLVEDGIALTDEWSFSLENKLNITQHTGGAGSGKAEFEAFTIKKQVDTASPDLLVACGSGAHFHGVELHIFKSGGKKEDPTSNLYLVWSFNQLVVEKLEWSFGDPAPEETVTFKFATCYVCYGKQEASGLIKKAAANGWNQISNTNNVRKSIDGAADPKQI